MVIDPLIIQQTLFNKKILADRGFRGGLGVFISYFLVVFPFLHLPYKRIYSFIISHFFLIISTFMQFQEVEFYFLAMRLLQILKFFLGGEFKRVLITLST